MVGHMTPYDPAYTQQLAAAQHALTASSGPWLAHQQALGLLYNSLLQQSSLWAFVENFRLFGVLCLVCLPLVLLKSPALPSKLPRIPSGMCNSSTARWILVVATSSGTSGRRLNDTVVEGNDWE